eukprot:scaffold12923_cov127-Skeletonema_dohrnii-CCMP3373.AAC.5
MLIVIVCICSRQSHSAGQVVLQVSVYVLCFVGLIGRAHKSALLIAPSCHGLISCLLDLFRLTCLSDTTAVRTLAVLGLSYRDTI